MVPRVHYPHCYPITSPLLELRELRAVGTPRHVRPRHRHCSIHSNEPPKKLKNNNEPPKIPRHSLDWSVSRWIWDGCEDGRLVRDGKSGLGDSYQDLGGSYWTRIRIARGPFPREKTRRSPFSTLGNPFTCFSYFWWISYFSSIRL